MKRTISLNQEKINYDLIQRSNARQIKARIVFGKLKVTAPTSVTISYIEKFLKENANYLLEQIEASSLANYEDGGYVYILGKKYEIIHRDLHQSKCAIHDEAIYVYGANIQRCIEGYLQDHLRNYILKYIQSFVKAYPSFPLPAIAYKRTSGRYGACYYTKNSVCFNPVLIHYKKEFIDSVIIHEMCHFKYHDHSSAFYHEIERYMPNYKEINGGKKVYD